MPFKINSSYLPVLFVVLLFTACKGEKEDIVDLVSAEAGDLSCLPTTVEYDGEEGEIEYNELKLMTKLPFERGIYFEIDYSLKGKITSIRGIRPPFEEESILTATYNSEEQLSTLAVEFQYYTDEVIQVLNDREGSFQIETNSGAIMTYEVENGLITSISTEGNTEEGKQKVRFTYLNSTFKNSNENIAVAMKNLSFRYVELLNLMMNDERRMLSQIHYTYQELEEYKIIEYVYEFNENKNVTRALQQWYDVRGLMYQSESCQLTYNCD